MNNKDLLLDFKVLKADAHRTKKKNLGSIFYINHLVFLSSLIINHLRIFVLEKWLRPFVLINDDIG